MDGTTNPIESLPVTGKGETKGIEQGLPVPIRSESAVRRLESLGQEQREAVTQRIEQIEATRSITQARKAGETHAAVLRLEEQHPPFPGETASKATEVVDQLEQIAKNDYAPRAQRLAYTALQRANGDPQKAAEIMGELVKGGAFALVTNTQELRSALARSGISLEAFQKQFKALFPGQELPILTSEEAQQRLTQSIGDLEDDQLAMAILTLEQTVQRPEYIIEAYFRMNQVRTRYLQQYEGATDKDGNLIDLKQQFTNRVSAYFTTAQNVMQIARNVGNIISHITNTLDRLTSTAPLEDRLNEVEKTLATTAVQAEEDADTQATTEIAASLEDVTIDDTPLSAETIERYTKYQLAEALLIKISNEAQGNQNEIYTKLQNQLTQMRQLAEFIESPVTQLLNLDQAHLIRQTAVANHMQLILLEDAYEQASRMHQQTNTILEFPQPASLSQAA